MSKLLTGKEVVASLTEKLKIEASELKKNNIEPTLAIVRVGENESDMAYERGAAKRAEAVGVLIKKVILPKDATQAKLVEEINLLNNDEAVDGILLFRPLPKHIDDEVIRNAISPEKDVDGITDVSMAGVYSGTNQGFPPCTAEAVIELLDYYQVELTGKKVVVVGRSLVIGKPVSMMLLAKNATVTICHTKTKDMDKICKNAEILVVAAGKAKAIGAEFLKDGQTVIDVGVSMGADGKLCGDVNFDEAESIAEAITPVPGGVGMVTSAMLIKHVVTSAKRRGGMI